MSIIPSSQGAIQASNMAVQDALPLIGSPSRENLQSVVNSIDSDLAKLFENNNVQLIDGGLITYLGTTVQFTQALKLHINSKIAGGAPVIIDLASTTRTVSADGRMIYATINRTAGTATITDDASTLPTVVAANKEVFLIAKRMDSGDGIKRLYFRNGSAFDEGQTARLGSAGSGTGVGGVDVPAPGYKWKESDTFGDLPTASDSKILTASGYTSAVHNIAKKLYAMSVDKTKTVAAGSTGTTLNISSAPSFTVQTGDIAYIQKYQRRTLACGTGTDKILYSDDGTTWSASGSNASTIFTTRVRDAVWNGSKFVAVGNGTNTTAYSTDGKTWTGGTDIFSAGGGQGRSIAWNGSIFVATGDGTNKLAYSSDGISWTAATNPFTTRINTVAFNGIRWVVGGSGTATLAYSSDGVNWTTISSPFTTEVDSVIWTGKIWVAVGSGSFTSATSTDGITWVGSNNLILTSAMLVWDGLKIVAIGTYLGTNYAHSVDGINWAPTYVPSIGAITAPSNFGFDGNKFYLGDDTGAKFSSYDGATWSSMTGGSQTATNGICCSPSPYTFPAIETLLQIETSSAAGQFRRISTVGSQTSFTLDSAFTGGDATTGDRVMIAQALYTKDLVNVGSSAQRTRARDYFSGSITNVFLDYQDSVTSGDDVSDRVFLNRIAASASNSGLASSTSDPVSNTFGPLFTRPIRANTISDYTLLTNTTQERLFLIFFPDPHNPDISSIANILDYEVSFFGDDSTVNSGVLEDAICFSDNSTTPHNCTVAVVSSQTEVTLDWSFVPNVRNGESQVEVYVDGKRINKFISTQKTPSTDTYFTEQVDSYGIYRKIRFNSDLSSTPLEIKVIKRLGVNIDVAVSTVNRVNQLVDFIVGSAAQVANGTATHATLTDAITAAVSGQSILILNNVTITDSPTVNKKLNIYGKGNGSSITGSLTVTSAGAKSSFELLRFSSSITFQAGADYCFGRLWQATGQTLSNDVSNTSNDLSVIQE